MEYSGAAAAAAAQAIANAIKASGTLISLEPDQFEQMLARQTDPLIVTARGGLFGRKYQYLSSYKGLAFHTLSAAPLSIPVSAEIVTARKIWIPG